MSATSPSGSFNCCFCQKRAEACGVGIASSFTYIDDIADIQISLE